MKNPHQTLAGLTENSYLCNAYISDSKSISFGRGQCPVSYAGYFYSLMLQPIAAAFRIHLCARERCYHWCKQRIGSRSICLPTLTPMMHMKALTLPATGRTESPIRVMTGISLVPQPITASDTARRIMRAVRQAVTLRRAAVAVIALGMACAMFGLMVRPSQDAAVLTACGTVTAISATLLYFHLMTAGKGGEL